jgi:hypothetical protein
MFCRNRIDSQFSFAPKSPLSRTCRRAVVALVDGGPMSGQHLRSMTFGILGQVGCRPAAGAGSGSNYAPFTTDQLENHHALRQVSTRRSNRPAVQLVRRVGQLRSALMMAWHR